jgi:hypothetical protein
MNIPDDSSQSLETVFWVKNTYLRRDLVGPGSGIEKFGSGIRCKHPGTAALVSVQKLTAGSQDDICFSS